ncbi:MAG: methionyl-tRNA formyltransferase [Albidovulum sp.]|nr:methionyl-tRNA formyltransferase [Albidovulum sp.]MDE0531928.1 methionyl-tRNA formyltransferase [Albidovulum sp.]
MRIAFFGSSEFAVPSLDSISSSRHEIACVYSQPPKPARRGRKERQTPVGARALELGLELRCPESFAEDRIRENFSATAADVAVVAAYGIILPKKLLIVPRLGFLNIHPSLLPRWRGAAPIQRAIMAGDAETGVCIMKVEPCLDSGQICMKKFVRIGSNATASRLHDQLARLGSAMIVEALDRIIDLEFTPQLDREAVYAKKIEKYESRVDWSRSSAEVDRQIRGLSAVPGAWSLFNGDRIKFLDSRVAKATGRPGEVVAENLTIACGTGAVRILRLQRPSKRPMEAGEFLRGYRLPIGSHFDAAR